VRERLRSHPELSAQRLFEEVREAGYDGGYGRVGTGKTMRAETETSTSLRAVPNLETSRIEILFSIPIPNFNAK
jgi:hypothetical protein